MRALTSESVIVPTDGIVLQNKYPRGNVNVTGQYRRLGKEFENVQRIRIMMVDD
jgi:hypothetical protein